MPRFNFSARAKASGALALAAPAVCAAAQPAAKANNRNATRNLTRLILVRLIIDNPFGIDTLMATG
jgi:hypothetical protein